MSNQPTKCYFPGSFAPPTKFDLKIAQWLSRKIYDVSEVIVVIGKSEPGEITPDQKADIWGDYLPRQQFGSITIHKDLKNSPLTSIYKMHERLPEDAFSIALPEHVAKNETFQSHFEIFPNYEIIITPKYDSNASTSMTAAAEAGDLREFSKYVPTELSIEKKKEIMDYLKPVDKDPQNEVLGERYLNGMLGNLYTQYGLK